ncbi:ATP-dependent DNA helicase Q1-like isoform X1 [Styela clava]
MQRLTYRFMIEFCITSGLANPNEMQKCGVLIMRSPVIKVFCRKCRTLLLTYRKDLKNEFSSVSNSISEIQRKVQVLLERQEKYQARKKDLELEIEKRESLFNKNKLTKDADEIKMNSTDFDWSQALKNVLWDNFGVKNLREMQLETMNATMCKRDVILIMPTGGGKSLCYQAPALISGLTLVISPLISLIEDQVLSLKNLGINAKKLSASSTRQEVNEIHKEMVAKDSELKLLYVTPEKISKSKRFMAQLEKCYKSGNLSRIAIDEVHCASQWGNDFRPDYKILGILKRQFPDAPLLGLTATSTDKVTLDTKKILNIPFAMVFKTCLNRPNLYYEVRTKPDSYDSTIDDIVLTINSRFEKSSGIIYCFSCKNCEEVSDSLCKRGLSASAYHARMEAQDRYRVHKLWLGNKIKIICATVAFGMGIDKPDVRFVIHFSMSKSIENYYQESGRAGRDGLPALCLLYYGFADIFRQSTMVLTEQTGLTNLNKVLEYCQNLNKCRRKILFSHFGNEWHSNLCRSSCDVCCSANGENFKDITELCNDLVSITQKSSAAGERLTGAKLVDAARGRGKFKTQNSNLKAMTSEDVQRILVFMIMNQYLKEDFHFTPYATISYLVPGPQSSLISFNKPELSLPSSKSNSRKSSSYKTFCENWETRTEFNHENHLKREMPVDEGPSSSKKFKLNMDTDEPCDLTVDENTGVAIIMSDSEDDLL